MQGKKSDFYKLAREAAKATQESLVSIKKKPSSLQIGVPKETSFQENRVGLSPNAVHMLVANGHEVIVESGAGGEAKFSDHDYSEAGAQITYDARKAFECQIIMKVGFPQLDEIEMMKSGQVLFSALALPMLKREQLEQLMKKKTTAICFEYLKDENKLFPVIQSMSEVAGSAAILIAAEYLTNVYHGKGVMLGGITGVPPSDVVIMGAGTVGQMAAKAAIGLGAEVKVFDNSLFKLRRLKHNISNQVYTSIIHPNVLTNSLQTADVVIGALRVGEGRTPCVVTEEMVAQMKSGSVIVDVSIDQGGCIETSEVTNHADPVFTKHDVIHYCVPNIPSRAARTASYALSNIFGPMLVEIGDYGGLNNLLWDKLGVRHGTYLYKGHLTHKFLGERFQLPTKEIDLLIASHI